MSAKSEDPVKVAIPDEYVSPIICIDQVSTGDQFIEILTKIVEDIGLGTHGPASVKRIEDRRNNKFQITFKRFK